MKNKFIEVMDFRHACKVFDDTKKIADEDIKYILEAGRKSPSSFGMEAWKFLVITNDELKAKLKPVCWDQAQITSCSHLIILLAGIDSVKVEEILDIDTTKYQVSLVFGGVAHFTKTEFYLKAMPEYLPLHEIIVYASGVLEIVLGL